MSKRWVFARQLEPGMEVVYGSRWIAIVDITPDPNPPSHKWETQKIALELASDPGGRERMWLVTADERMYARGGCV
jgi:hypothetical protein